MQKDKTTEFMRLACDDFMNVSRSLARATEEQQATDIRDIAKNGELLMHDIESDGLTPDNVRRLREWGHDVIQASCAVSAEFRERIRSAGATILEALADHEPERPDL